MNVGNLDGQGLAEIRNFNFQKLSSAPSTNLASGRFYFSTTDNTLYVYNGTTWINALSQGGYTFINGIESPSGTMNVQLKIASGTAAGNVTLIANTDGLSASITELSVASTSSNYLNITNHELSANVDTSVTANSTNLITSGAVETAIALALTGALKYQTTWTATNQTNYTSITLPVKKGYMYAVSGNATVEGIEWNSGDYLIIKNDVAAGGTITSSDVEKIDNSEASNIVRLDAIQTITNKTIDADDNTISNLETDNFKSGVVRTAADGIRPVGTATDTSLVTESNIATVLSNRTYTEQNSSLTVVGGICTWTVTHNLNSSNVSVDVYEVSTGDKVMYDTTITSANVVTVKILSASNISADTYKIVVKL